MGMLPLAASAQGTAPVQPYGTNDGGGSVLNVLPPGQGRYMNGPELVQAQTTGTQPPHNTDQIPLYDSLVQGTPGMTADKLTDYFKDATFGVKPDDIDSEYSPREGVVVLRDIAFGVPHVYGTTRGDVMFGAGYVSAEDRLFMMDTLRHVGRGRSSEFLGASEANLAMDRAAYATAGYTEEELQAMIDRVVELDPVRGAIALQDVIDYTAGVNQYIDEARMDPSKLPGEYEALQVTPDDWMPTDTVAVASLIGSQLGVGGGGELGNAAFFNALVAQGFGKKKAMKIFKDLRVPNDPEAPMTTEKRFPCNAELGKVKPKSMALPDRPDDAAEQMRRRTTSLGYLDGPFGQIPLAFPSAMSNAVLVGAEHSVSGRPLAVMGPQVAYWSPEILMELDLHGPGIDARGVGFPGISQYVLLGRGQDYAWSATSAGGDQVDTFAEKLCDPEGGEVAADSTFYMQKGKCVEMYSRTDPWTAKPSAGGIPGEPSQESVVVKMTTQRTDDGIVQARATVEVSRLHSSRREPLSVPRSTPPSPTWRSRTVQDRWAEGLPEGVRALRVHVQLALRRPGRHRVPARRLSPDPGQHTNPDLPVWGKAKWEWRGMLSFKKTPKDISPSTGYLVSWNNKQAPRFTSNDANWGYGSIYRSQMLSDPVADALEKGEKLSLVDLVDIMGVAATTDLRGYRVLPYMLDVIGKDKDAQVQTVLDLLKAWVKDGAQREAPEPGGEYTHAAAIAVMDAWWAKAIEAIFKPTLKDAFAAIPMGFDNEPGPLGSAYQGGFYGQVEKDLRTVLDERVKGKFSRVYCGKGKLKACRNALLASLRAAIEEVVAASGEDPAAWDAGEEDDLIQFTAVGVQGQDPMQWQNRPTFQQVLEFRPLD